MVLACVPRQLDTPVTRPSLICPFMREGCLERRCNTVCSNHSSTATAHLSGAGCGTKAARCLCCPGQGGNILFLALPGCPCRSSRACLSAAALGTRPSMPPQQQEPTCWGAMGTPMHHSLTPQSTRDMWSWGPSCCHSSLGWPASCCCCSR